MSVDPFYLVDGRVVVLSQAERLAVAQSMRSLGLDLESAVRLALDMRD